MILNYWKEAGRERVPDGLRLSTDAGGQSGPVVVFGDLDGEEFHPPRIVLQAHHHIIKGRIYPFQLLKIRLFLSPIQGVQGWDVVRFNVTLVPRVPFALGEGPVLDYTESTEHLVYQNIL